MAVEEAEERLTKFSVHETVCDGIATAGYVCQQLHQTNAGATDYRVHQIGSEKVPRIDYVQRRPAHEKFQDYDEQHSDHLQHIVIPRSRRAWRWFHRVASLILVYKRRACL